MESMTETAEYNLSDLVRNPSEVVEEAERHDVVIHRRGKADMRLALVSRQDRMVAANNDLTELVAKLASDRTGRAVLGTYMMDVYPWLRFLPEQEIEDSIKELLDTAQACASIGNFSAYEAEVAAWRHTAEIHADPDLFHQLSGPVEIDEGLGPVSAPEAS